MIDQIMTKATIGVGVYDTTGKALPKARVRLEASGASQAVHELRYDAGRGLHRSHDLAPGTYVMVAEVDGMQTDRRAIRLDPAGIETVVVLGPKGAPFLYRAGVRVPFEPHAELIGVALEHAQAKATAERLAATAQKLKLTAVDTSKEIQRQDVHLLRAPDNTEEASLARMQSELADISGVRAVGSVVKIDKESVSFLTRELVVKFRAHIDLDQVPAIAQKFELTPVRRLPQAGNAFLYRAPMAATYALLDVASRLVDSGLVEYAEPNLFSTIVLDALNPNDFLFPMQWHLSLVNCPQAWKVINDNIGAASAFGNAGLSIAVCDSGVDVANPDFTGTVSGGAAKVAQIFDFTNMVPNNALRPSGHGTCCAGIATALVNNPSVVAGQTEGVTGAAGNCRLFAIRTPSGGTETNFSDMYTWVGGFNPNSTTTGFPAAISPGADIFTNSFGAFTGTPISGLMKDTFDLLTTYGRGGRGALLFFSCGNAAMDFTLVRPWAAYTRTFAVAASSLFTDGVTEVHAPYSNFGGVGIVDFCTPSDSALGAAYDPPRTYGTLTASDPASEFSADVPSHWTVSTTAAAAAAVGATSLTVATSAGFAGGQFLVIGTPGTVGAEFSMVTSIPNATHLNVTPLKNAHAVGTTIFGGPANSLSNFGGTSSSTPLAAGIGALALTMRPALSWIQVRDILRATAVKIQAANTDPIGIWIDANGVASNQPGYLGPVYSRWFGSGRLDALAVVNAIIALGTPADVLVRDNLLDVGTVPASGAFWNSPDLWVRNATPAAEGPAALPPNYATPGPHQDAAASHDNYIYVRLRNIGPVASSNFFVRVYLTHWAGTEFIYPTNFIPTTRPSAPLPAPLVPGTYLIGEVAHGPLAANAIDTVNVQWLKAAIPPQTVVVNGITVTWHPCLLVEVSPQDGPTASGNHVWDSNNLGQKNISINYLALDGSFASVLVLGNLKSDAEIIELMLERMEVPPEVRLYVDVLDPLVKAELHRMIGQRAEELPVPSVVELLEETPVLVEARSERESVFRLPRSAHVELREKLSPPPGRALDLHPGDHNGREVFWIGPALKTIPLRAGRGGLIPVIIGGVVPKGHRPVAFTLGVTQLDRGGRISGAAAVEVRSRGR